jgi:hypothetical protein
MIDFLLISIAIGLLITYTYYEYKLIGFRNAKPTSNKCL